MVITRALYIVSRTLSKCEGLIIWK